jgi:lipid-A-disaccharide synthase
MKKIYIIAGEASGDFLGAGVIRELKKNLKDIEIIGVGGPLMDAEGLKKSLFDIKEISVGGLFEIIPHILKIKRLINKTVEDILETKPEVLLTIDSPGFSFRVTKMLRKQKTNIKMVHLVAPSVWAWRKGRAKKISKLYDELLTLFDFEPKYFIKHGLKATFVGHAAIEKFDETEKQREDILLLMPGSRVQEIKSLLPIFVEASKTMSFSRIVIPTLKHLEPLINTIVGQKKIEIISEENEKIKLYQTAKLAIVASGTATLELALTGCPMIVCYKLSNITYKILKMLVKVKYISLVNIILNKAVVPELIQSDCNSHKILETFNNLDRKVQMSSFKQIRRRLISKDRIFPSEKVANILFEYIK